MQIARVRRLLWLTGGVASAGAIAVLVITAALPLSTAGDSFDRPAGPSTEAGAKGAEAVLPLSAFASAWAVQLRRPLIDPPPAAAASVAGAVALKPAPVGIRLVGTIIDGQHARGVFMTGLSTVELKGVGDRVGGGIVLGIEQNSATLARDGETITLSREKRPFDPSGESYQAASDAKGTSE